MAIPAVPPVPFPGAAATPTAQPAAPAPQGAPSDLLETRRGVAEEALRAGKWGLMSPMLPGAAGWGPAAERLHGIYERSQAKAAAPQDDELTAAATPAAAAMPAAVPPEGGGPVGPAPIKLGRVSVPGQVGALPPIDAVGAAQAIDKNLEAQQAAQVAAVEAANYAAGVERQATARFQQQQAELTARWQQEEKRLQQEIEDTSARVVAGATGDVSRVRQAQDDVKAYNAFMAKKQLAATPTDPLQRETTALVFQNMQDVAAFRQRFGPDAPLPPELAAREQDLRTKQQRIAEIQQARRDLSAAGNEEAALQAKAAMAEKTIQEESEIQPGRMLRGWRGIVAAIAAGLGAYSAALTKGPNMAYNLIMKMIDEDIADQNRVRQEAKDRRGQKMQELSAGRSRYLTEQDRLKLEQASALEGVAKWLKTVQSGSPEARNALQTGLTEAAAGKKMEVQQAARTAFIAEEQLKNQREGLRQGAMQFNATMGLHEKQLQNARDIAAMRAAGAGGGAGMAGDKVAARTGNYVVLGTKALQRFKELDRAFLQGASGMARRAGTYLAPEFGRLAGNDATKYDLQRPGIIYTLAKGPYGEQRLAQADQELFDLVVPHSWWADDLRAEAYRELEGVFARAAQGLIATPEERRFELEQIANRLGLDTGGLKRDTETVWNPAAPAGFEGGGGVPEGVEPLEDEE